MLFIGFSNMKLIMATQNPGKAVEMQKLLHDFDIEVISAKEAGFTEEIIEDGKTLEQNAYKKADTVAKKIGQWSVADDTGLFIDALNGQPGVHSARWAGEQSGDNQKVAKLLHGMKGIPDEKRQAYFESVVALVSPKNKCWIFSGKINGIITQKPMGRALPKLPYDLIFKPDGYEKTFAEMTANEKNSISHRGLAFKKLREFIQSDNLT